MYITEKLLTLRQLFLYNKFYAMLNYANEALSNANDNDAEMIDVNTAVRTIMGKISKTKVQLI